MTDKETFTSRFVAQSVGLEESELHRLVEFGATRDADGNWPQSSAVTAMLAFQKDRWQWASNGELAELLGVTRSRISHLIRDGIFTQEVDSRMPRQKNIKELASHLLALSKQKQNSWDDKLEIARIDKELKQIELDRAQNKSLDAGAVEKAWVNIVLLCKQRLLRIPNKVAPRLPFCKSEADMEIELQKEIDEALLELSRPPDYETEKQQEVK